MCLFKVIVLLLIVSTVAVHSRPLRKRRQDARSSAYYGANPMAIYPYLDFVLGSAGIGNRYDPVGNNWFVPGGSWYPYNYQNPYGMPPTSYMGSLPYPNSYNNYGAGSYNSAGVNLQYPYDRESYIGQSYMTSGAEYLPLPGYNRRRQQSLKSGMASEIDNAPQAVERK